MRNVRLTDEQISILILMLDKGAVSEGASATMGELDMPQGRGPLTRLRSFGLVRSLQEDKTYRSGSIRYWLSERGLERAQFEKGAMAA